MENNFDTIVAIATPMSAGAIGIIRISGDNAFEVVKSIFTGKLIDRQICYGFIKDNERKIDEVIVLPFHAPKSYTGEDVVEIQSHGSYIILNEILELILSKNTRLANRGEFTKRAFLNHRIDLSQAEAVLDLINSKSTKSADSALNNLGGYLKNKIQNIKSDLTDIYSKLIASIDFPEDVSEVNPKDIYSICSDNIIKIKEILSNSKSHNFIRDGINICLVGKPNVGKSSLFNALLNYNRSIVTDIEGTTRDTIKESLNLDGYIVNFIDTAGIRNKNNADKVEKIGIENSIETIKQSDIAAFLFENSFDEIDSNLVNLAKDKQIMYIQTKYDINSKVLYEDAIPVSSRTGFNIDKLKEKTVELIKNLIPEDSSYTTNLRQQKCLDEAKNYLENVLQSTKQTYYDDLCAQDLKLAILALDEITGEQLTDRILDNIFDNFCIGK